MRQWQNGTKLVLTLMLVVPLSFTALGQGPDEVAQLVQRSIEDIELQIRIAPMAAQEDLERQKRQLDTLRSEAPDHPLLPSLERRVEELDDEIAAALVQQPETADETEQFVPLHAPAEARRELREVETLQTRADREMMRGASDSAASYLSEAESLLEAIEEEYGDRIPPGYAALIVAKERLAALQDQLGRVQKD
jgi:cell fate (sporulation/competence/biofilm development) regulator YlbF (YheA/YmcA/DUF963 family)